jgi:hypothetical protein
MAFLYCKNKPCNNRVHEYNKDLIRNKGTTVMKSFNKQANIGKAKYVINHHDGVQTYKDGSPFFGIAIFSNKKKCDAFISDLVHQGYREITAGVTVLSNLKAIVNQTYQEMASMVRKESLEHFLPWLERVIEFARESEPSFTPDTIIIKELWDFGAPAGGASDDCIAHFKKQGLAKLLV